LLCSIILCFSAISSTRTCFAETAGIIYIRADGSVDPPTAPISTVDNTTYILTGNVSNYIVVERDSIIVDGQGHTVQGTGNGTGLTLSGRNNLIIKNTEITTFSIGIELHSSSNSTIYENNITNSGCGIYLVSSSDNNVSDNNLTNNVVGINLASSSSNNTISDNKITVNSYAGIQLSSTYNTVSGNIVTNNGRGIMLVSSSDNAVSGNSVTNNTDGIVLLSSSNNTVYHNNFVNNTVQTDFFGGSLNVLDNGYPLGGNYWSDYNGTDNNQDGIGDGIGDIPYVINENNTDHYPLMYQYGSIQNLNTSLIYLTIQQAIDANETLDGHVIHVETGTYEMIYTRINKSVSLLGEGMENTTIIGTIEDLRQIPIFDVFSDNVTISGFTLTEGYTAVDILASYTHITNCNISDNIHGIFAGHIYELFGAVTIDGNIIANNTGNGIHLSTWSNVISNNVIFGNSPGGIVLDTTGMSTNSTQVFGNTIENNQNGVVLGPGSNNNTLFHNNFLNNTVQVDVWSILPYVGNEWAQNYWSDYNGTGDTPYVIDANNQDPYPLMSSYVIPEFPTFVVLPLFIIATLLAIVIYKRRILTRTL
jgi:parallel beta-helix repeat protein